MWERYGFYVVQTLLALYAAMHMGWDDAKVYKLVGSFTALTYVSPVIGGWIADKLIGQKKAVLLGTIVLFISYLLISFFKTDKALCVALSGVAVGTGLLKPNISSLLGNEYHDRPASRESGFTIFYMGITMGIILGTTLPSLISEKFGWSSAFFSASIGMILAGITFIHGICKYKIQDYFFINTNFEKSVSAFGLICTLWFLSYYLLTYPHLADTVFIAVGLVCVVYIIFCINKEHGEQARRTIVIGLLCIISIIFWTFYFQMFMSLTLFIVRAVNPKLLGINFPPPFYVGIQSLGMIILGIILSRSNKNKNSKSQQAIISGNKFFFSICCMTLAYALIVLISKYSEPSILITPLLLIPTYLIISIAELFLSPVGLSSVTLLASRDKVSTMLGIFFVSLGTGGYLSGKLAGITSLPIGVTNIAEIKQHYVASFTKLLFILFVSTIISAFLNYLIRRLMKNIKN
jgi:POT family proton-dependent oligopeptide transporter